MAESKGKPKRGRPEKPVPGPGHSDDQVIKKLEQVLSMQDVLLGMFNKVQKEVEKMAGELDALTTQVTASIAVEQAAVNLLNQIAAALAGAVDPTKLTALAAQLKASADALQAAITADTPPAPPAP